MHIIVRHDLFYIFLSGVINVENKEKSVFAAHFHKVFRSRLLAHFDLRREFCAKLKALQSDISLEDSSFGSNFREAIILNLCWVVFHGILPQIASNLYKNFTNDAIKLSKKKKFSGSKSFSVYTLMKIHNRGKLHQYSICGC